MHYNGTATQLKFDHQVYEIKFWACLMLSQPQTGETQGFKLKSDLLLDHDTRYSVFFGCSRGTV